MGELRSHDFNILRTHPNFYNEEIAKGYSCVNYLNDESVSRVRKTFLQTIARNPYIVNDDSPEGEMFITYDFETQNHLGETVVPEGLASAFVSNSPTISLNTHAYWEVALLNVLVIETAESQSLESVVNFCTLVGVQVWHKGQVRPIPLNSRANIELVFPIDRYHFEQRAIDEMIEWYYDDVRYHVRIKALIKDAWINPHTGGIGQTEVLVGQEGMASKRINKKDRLTYTYTQEIITIHSCRGHYDD